MTTPLIVIRQWRRSESVSFPLSATQQKVLGSFFLLHGLAHAAIGIWAAETGRWWMVASLWELAMVGFIAAGFGALGVAGCVIFGATKLIHDRALIAAATGIRRRKLRR